MVLPLAPPSVMPSTSSGRSLPPFPFPVQVKAVGHLGEPQEGVHAGDNDPGVDGQDLDPDQRYADEHVDDEALVEDEFDDVGETARTAAPRPLDVPSAALLLSRYRHRSTPRSRSGRYGLAPARTAHFR